MKSTKALPMENNQNEKLQLIKSAFNNALEAITVFNSKGEIVLCNNAVADILNRSTDDLVGKTLYDLLPKKAADQHFQAIQNVYSGGEETIRNLELEINGQPRWFQGTLKPIQDDQGKVQFVCSHTIEDTEIRRAMDQLNQADAKLQTLLENSIDMILLADQDCRILLFNHTAAKRIQDIEGITLIPGMLLDDLSPDPDERTMWQGLYQRALAGEAFRQEVILANPDGGKIHFEAAYQPIFQGDQVVGFSEITRDITERKQAELALAESEERFRQLAENIHEVFWISSPDWSEIYYISPAYEEVWGQSCESLYQNAASWGASVIEEDREILQAELEVKIKGDLSDPKFPEYRIRRPDGSIRWIAARSFPIRDEDGSINRIAGIAEDITERKRTEAAIRESETRYRKLFSTMLNGFALYDIIFDAQGSPVDFRILNVNQAFEEMTGLKASEIIGHTLMEITPEAEHYWVDSFLQVAATGEPIQLKNYSQDFDKYFNLYAYRPEAGKFAILFADVTKEVRTELALQKLNEELEKRVNERTTQLERINKDLRSFSYSVSHDLRAPLRAISGFGQILMDEYSDHFEGEPKQMLERMVSASKKMDSLIDGLLTLSRISQTGLEVEPIDLSQLASQVYFSCLTNINPKHEVRFTAHETPVAEGDPRLLEAALTNLISNAIKFTKTRVPAIIEFGHVIREDQTVYYLKDNGIGILMEQAEKLFAPFQRHDPQGEFEGSGIGLTIVQQIIERHNGKIWVESELEHGSTFYFQICPATLYQ